MNKHDLVDFVGGENYRNASMTAQMLAEHFGEASYDHRSEPILDSSVVHDLGDMLFDSDLDDVSKVNLLLDVYQDIPTYWFIALIAMHWEDLSPDARRVFWDRVRDYLAGGDQAMVKPLGYGLAVDFFEDDRHLEEAWRELVQSTSNPRALERVFQFAGPVPSELRDQLLRRLGHPS